jgi:uncharacterized protein
MHGRTGSIPLRDAANREKHGLPLLFGDRVFEDGEHLILPSIRPVDGEERFKAIGLVDGRLYTAALLRFISVRRSNRGEERAYRPAG